MNRAYRLEIGGRDVSSIVNDRLSTLELTDNDGFESDVLAFTLDNRDFRIPIPNADAPVKLWLGRDGRLAHMGLFLVNDAVLTGRPHLMRVECRAADMAETLKEPRTRSWEGATLGNIAASIAAAHGLTPAVSEFLAGIAFPHVLQTEESDLNLLTRLVAPYDGMIKPAQGALVIVERGAGLTASGEKMPTVVIHEHELQPGYSISPRARQKYNSVTCEWYDATDGSAGVARAGKGGDEGKPAFLIREKPPSAALGQARCDAKLRELARGTIEVSFTTALGDNRLMAGTQVRLGNGFHPEFIGMELSIKSARHMVQGAYTTGCTAERAND